MYLSDINVSKALVQCAEYCDEHVSTICQLHDNILESCIKATVKSISQSKPVLKINVEQLYQDGLISTQLRETSVMK